MNKRVFDIVKVEQASIDTWLVSGRAIEDIEVGDLVKVGGSGDESPICSSPFAILGISTYGHETPILDRMWTGTLTVQGVSGGNLFDGQMFVRAPEALKIAPTLDHDLRAVAKQAQSLNGRSKTKVAQPSLL